jgi:hypothetical protein
MSRSGEIVIVGDPSILELWPETPLYAWDYDALLEQAKGALQRRREGYPKLVERGAMTQAEAEEDIAAWELIEAEWRWIVDGSGELPPVGSLDQRLGAIDLALERVGTELRRGNRQHAVFRQSHLLQAMRWHLERLDHGAPAVHRFTRLTREIRAEMAKGEPAQKEAA